MENNEEQDLQPDTTVEDTTTEGENIEGAEDTTDWKAEALKYKAISDRQGKKLQEDNKPKEQSNSSIERLELKIDGYSKEEIDVIMENGGINSLNNPLIKKGLEVMRQENANKAKYLEASGSGSTSKRKEKSPDDMTETERAELFHKTVNG